MTTRIRRRKFDINKFTIYFASALMSGLLIYSTTNLLIKSDDKEPVTGYTITKKQSLRLVRAIGTNGYIGLSKNGCLEPMKEYLNTGKWSDNWCGSHYFHVDWKEIK